MKLVVCIGSSCHLKGSRPVVETLRARIAQQHLEDQIELSGVFCMGSCRGGVCAAIDEERFSLSPETANDFFDREVLPRLG